MQLNKRIITPPPIFIIILIIIFSMISMIVIFLQVSNESIYLNTFTENQLVINDLMSDLNVQTSISERIDSFAKPPNVVTTEQLFAASLRGQAVADYQNLFYTPGIGHAEMLKRIARNFDAIDACFMPDVVNVRTPWYFVEDMSDLKSYPDCKWQFEVIYDFGINDIPVVWRCINSAGEVLAYATAVYDAPLKRFKDAQSFITAIGDNYIIPEDDLGAYESYESDSYRPITDPSLDVSDYNGIIQDPEIILPPEEIMITDDLIEITTVDIITEYESDIVNYDAIDGQGAVNDG